MEKLEDTLILAIFLGLLELVWVALSEVEIKILSLIDLKIPEVEH